ncbi:hypothetical protein CsSME_00016987 [Camellia sinensis var. sinensis]
MSKVPKHISEKFVSPLSLLCSSTLLSTILYDIFLNTFSSDSSLHFLRFGICCARFLREGRQGRWNQAFVSDFVLEISAEVSYVYAV